MTHTDTHTQTHNYCVSTRFYLCTAGYEFWISETQFTS